MLEYQLQYRGKKAPFKTPPIIKPEFTFGTAPVWVPAHVGDRLMQINPSMFYKLQERDIKNPVEDTKDIKAKPELEVPEIISEEEEKCEYTCDKCGKGYNIEGFYKKHIAKCANDK